MAGRRIHEFDVTLLDNASTVSFALQDCAWGSIQLPSAITGNILRFQYSNDNANWTDVPVEGLEANPVLAANVGANTTHALPYKTFSAKFCQVTMDTQTADRTIKVFLRD